MATQYSEAADYVPSSPSASDPGTLSGSSDHAHSPPSSPHAQLPPAAFTASSDIRSVSLTSLGLSRVSTATKDSSNSSGKTVSARQSVDQNGGASTPQRPPAVQRVSTVSFSPIVRTSGLPGSGTTPDHPLDPERGTVYGFMAPKAGQLGSPSSPALELRRFSTRQTNFSEDGDADGEADGDVGLTTGERVRRDEYLGTKIRGGLLSQDQLGEMRRRRPGKEGRRLHDFHAEQNEHIENLLAPLSHHTTVGIDQAASSALKVKIAIYSSMLANFLLSILQLYAGISSLSLSLIATMIDSVFDVWSNIFLWALHRKSSRIDLQKFPAGGARLSTIGNIVYGFFMGAVNLVIIVESVRSIATHKGDDTNDFHLAALIAVAAALVVKICLFLYCYALKGKSSQVQMLWEDHRNDIFVNGFGVLMSAGGAKLRWWLDPAGAILIASGVALSWGRTCKGEFEQLAGKSAPREFLQLVTYKALTFSEDIECIDSVKAYHSGPNYVVEIDIVLAGGMPLSQAHDIGQALQDQLEELPSVERAYVHLDFETSHKPEHAKSK